MTDKTTPPAIEREAEPTDLYVVEGDINAKTDGQFIAWMRRFFKLEVRKGYAIYRPTTGKMEAYRKWLRFAAKYNEFLKDAVKRAEFLQSEEALDLLYDVVVSIFDNPNVTRDVVEAMDAELFKAVFSLGRIEAWFAENLADLSLSKKREAEIMANIRRKAKRQARMRR